MSLSLVGRALAVGVLVGAACGCTAAPLGEADAGRGDANACVRDEDCQTGGFCTVGGACVAGACVGSAPRCAPTQICDAANSRCVTECAMEPDADADGEDAIACGGTDCDDGDAARRPGAVEVCDPAGRDEDCDPATYGFRDADGDGYPDAACCNGTACGSDCDDTAPGTNIAVPEVCNDIDDDCDTAIDEALVRTLTIDEDGDGRGSAASGAGTVTSCHDEPGYVLSADDCDDADPERAPDLPELCDVAGVDEDCSGVGNDAPGGCECTGSGDEVCGTVGPCAGATRTCVSGMWTACSTVPTTELCNTIDDDCDAMVDEALTVACYADADRDGYAAAGALPSPQCRSSETARAAAPWNGCPLNYTGRAPGAGAVDCCDADAHAFPGQGAVFSTISICAPLGFDYDCDGTTTSTGSLNVVESCSMYTTSGACAINLYSAASGWVGSVPACGAEGSRASSCVWSGSCRADSSRYLTLRRGCH